MTTTPNMHDKACEAFLDHLDAWLAGDFAAEDMQQHHDTCAACRHEAALARAIGGITAALPQLTGPDIHAPVTRSTSKSLLAQLLQAWRQPFVFAPALALVLALLAWTQLRTPDAAVDPELVIIDGVEYTRDDIRKAAADLQVALRYLDRYKPARVISAELDTGAPPRNPGIDDTNTSESNERQDGADAPTI